MAYRDSLLNRVNIVQGGKILTIIVIIIILISLSYVSYHYHMWHITIICGIPLFIIFNLFRQEISKMQTCFTEDLFDNYLFFYYEMHIFTI